MGFEDVLNEINGWSENEKNRLIHELTKDKTVVKNAKILGGIEITSNNFIVSGNEVYGIEGVTGIHINDCTGGEVSNNIFKQT